MKSNLLNTNILLLLPIFFLIASCNDSAQYVSYEGVKKSNSSNVPMTTGDRIAEINGLSGPEAVRYDEETDSYYISNFNGGGSIRDSNGFISRVNAETGHADLKFAKGKKYPLHAPRGMFIIKNILWVADIDGIHGFDKYDGHQKHFIDLSGFDPGFLNDITADNNGNLFVTDTRGQRVFKIQELVSSIALEDIDNPNGITFDPSTGLILIAPWNEGGSIRSFQPNDDSTRIITRPFGSKIDGIEVFNGYVIYAMQSDSSIQLYSNGVSTTLVKTEGKPADIGVDTKRGHLAVPFIALNRIDIWPIKTSK